MKNITIIMAVMAILGSNAAFAQNNNGNMGKGSAAGSNGGSSNGMGWAVGLGTLALLGVVVGVSASSASSDPSTFSH